MFHFPKRPGPRYDYLRRRQWNSEIPNYENVVAWYRAEDCCFTGTDYATPCAPGEDIGAVRDLSAYGAHMTPTGTTRQRFLIDNGFPAIFTATTGPDGQRILKTSVVLAHAYQVVVFRSGGDVWSTYGSVLGRTNGNMRTYLFSQGGNGTWNNAPVTHRKNGVAQAVGGTLSPLSIPMVFSVEVNTPYVVDTLELGSSESYYIPSLYIYEALAYSSVPTTEQLTETEAYLMDKYAIM